MPSTNMELISNYINGRKAHTTYINHTSIQRKFKTGVPKGGVLSSTLFSMYTADLPPHSTPVQVMAHADDITITSFCNTHTRNHTSSIHLHPHTHHVVTHGYVDKPCRNDGTAGLMDREVGWWTTSGKIGLPPLVWVRERIDNNNTNQLCRC